MARRKKKSKKTNVEKAVDKAFEEYGGTKFYGPGGPAPLFAGMGGFANIQPKKKARKTVAKKTGKRRGGGKKIKGGQNLGQALAMAGMAASAQKARTESFHAVSKEFGIQVASSASEFMFALGTKAVQVAVEASVTSLDDKAAPVVLGIAATGLRFYSDRYLSRKHPGLSKVLSSGASSSMGVTWSGKLQEWGMKAKEAAVAAAVKSGSKG